MAAANTKLFSPVRVGSSELEHRIAMAPMTRYRASSDHVPSRLTAKYYAQRAAIPGTLLISEAAYVSYRAGGYGYVPGVWNAEQLAAWKQVTDAVHAKKSKIWCQLWALGRLAKPLPGVEFTIADEGFPYAEHLASSSPVPAGEGFDSPREMSEEEIWRMVEDFATAAKNAVEVAGFDGVEVHGAHGYLVDQFTQDTCNKRTDAWGGSIENRSRFAIEICKAISAAIGPERVGIRLSPWARVQGMRMDDPVPQFTHLITGLSKLKLAFLHLVEPRAFEENPSPEENLEFALKAWGRERPVIFAGGYTPELAVQTIERFKDYDAIIAIGRRFISTPDLVYRIKKGIEWEAYDRSTFYRGPAVQKNGLEKGYTDYTFSKEFVAEFGSGI